MSRRMLLTLLFFGCFSITSCAQPVASSQSVVSLSPPSAAHDQGQVAVAPDNQDVVSLASGEAGSQYHFRVTRAYCDKTSRSTQSSSDQNNFLCGPDAVTIDDSHPASSTPNKSYLIAPYDFGMAVEYPGVLETSAQDFSVHSEHVHCTANNTATTNYLDSGSCSASAHFWIGDQDDFGGIFSTAYDAPAASGTSFDPTQSFVILASDTFGHTSHGDMVFILREEQDNYRFNFGFSGATGADDPATYKNYTRAKIDSSGKGYFDGGTQSAGADFAESVSTGLAISDYEPGDVLVIDTDADRRFTLSSTPYSTLVAGIYSTKPGVTATEHNSDDPKLASEIPMAVVGIVPCKVTTENGAISRGDLLVTSSRKGYAMRAGDQARLTGAIIGKALQPLAKGEGKIEVLVTLR